MNFNIKNIHTIYEADATSTNISATDKVINNISDTLDGNSELQKTYDDYCPISGEIFKAMKKTASDPKNLKIAVTNDNGEIKMFVEAVEFMTFCEAADKDFGEGADAIINTYSEDLPGVGVSDINIVFPCDAMNKGVIGSENRGIDTRNDWAMQLIRGCCRYGMKPRIGIEGNKQAVTEAATKSDAVEKFVKEKITKLVGHYDKIVFDAMIHDNAYSIEFKLTREPVTMQCFDMVDFGILKESDLNSTFKEIASFIRKDPSYKPGKSNDYYFKFYGTGYRGED